MAMSFSNISKSVLFLSNNGITTFLKQKKKWNNHISQQKYEAFKITISSSVTTLHVVVFAFTKWYSYTFIQIFLLGLWKHLNLVLYCNYSYTSDFCWRRTQTRNTLVYYSSYNKCLSFSLYSHIMKKCSF